MTTSAPKCERCGRFCKNYRLHCAMGDPQEQELICMDCWRGKTKRFIDDMVDRETMQLRDELEASVRLSKHFPGNEEQPQ